MDMIKLHNTSNKVRTIYEPTTGISHDIGPGVMAFPAKIADQFLADWPKDIIVFREVEIPAVAGDLIVWVANATGNPFAPKNILIDDKNHVNPLSEPATISWSMHRSQIERRDRVGMYHENVMPVSISLPPFTRLPVAKTIADFMLQRDAWSQWLTPPRHGRVVLCRAPTNFEPNETWPLADMRLYARMMNPTFFDQDNMKIRFPSEAQYGGDQQKLAAAKRNLFEHIYHMLIDDNFAPIPREGFERKRHDLEEKVAKRG